MPNTSFNSLLFLYLIILESFRILHCSHCRATCSPHFTLPCSFGAFDKCLVQQCNEICAKDGGRKMIGCYCRGSIEGPTMRACFCMGQKRPKTF
uniref:Uncharacterized protein n=2 Tax=Meloidogyne TaxID=189290 RepID=A0A6V7X4I2_MELEN|nr:unnamed protein product [Meloidogyne enterolobii]CAD2194149.1 unnamed protein product [Meloidogyne enterolobii]